MNGFKFLYWDDYEEGTWTLTAVGQTSAGTTTYSGRTGNYTKVGNIVTANGYIAISAINKLRINIDPNNVPKNVPSKVSVFIVYRF